MGHVLTRDDTLGLQDVFNIGGDLLLLPRVRLPNLSESLVLQKAGVIDRESSEIVRNTLSREMLSLESSYAAVKSASGKEPLWIEDLPLRQRTWLRYWYAATQEDPLAIINALPYTGVSYMVLDGGLCAKVARAFNLFRLQEVKQLGFLQAPWVIMEDQPLVVPLSEGTRYLHSLDVMMLSSLIGYNIGLSEDDLNTVRVAGFTHDFGTPAGGDSVKLIDSEAFDEDTNYKRLLHEKVNQEEWERIRGEYGIDETVLVDAVLNRGLLGQILDIADKLAYVARDVQTCLSVGVIREDTDAYIGIKALDEIVGEFPHVCDVWDSVRRHGKNLVFTDMPRLIAFLKARIVLFRELYYHPRARFGEYLTSRVLVKKLYDRGDITRDELLEMSDSELLRCLNKTYGEWNVTRVLSVKSNVRSFKNRYEAELFKEELEKTGHSFSLIENHLHSIKPGTHLLVETKEGPKPLLEAYRGDAKELFEMANMLPAVHVYYFGDDMEPDATLTDFLERLQ